MRERPEAALVRRRLGGIRRHVLATCFAGKAVGDELFQVVADFDPHLPIVDGQEDQRAVVLAALADAAAGFSNIFTGYSRMSPYGLKVGTSLPRRRAARLLQRLNQRLHRLLAGLVDDVGEVVDRLGQLGR